MKPISTKFRSTNVWNAFTLNCIAITLSTFMAVEAKSFFSSQELKVMPDGSIVYKTTWKSILAVLLVTFCTAFVSYAIMYWLFGFGGGMLVNGAAPVE
tara:strand:- start:5344 stop:5637 length:294 start_codon:yes stop_codon:yes gene_type:complete